MADWFDQNAPASAAGGGDWFDKNSPAVTVAAPSGPTRHNDSAGKPKPGTPHADDGIPNEGIMGMLFTPFRGAQRIAAGAHRLGATGEGETRGGVSDIIHGTMELLSPYLPEAATAAPLAFISSLAGSKIGGATARALTSDDASPGARQLAETTGEVLGGGLGLKGGKATVSGIRAAGDMARNAPDTVGRAARAVPDAVTSGLSKVEKAATLSPAVSDAIEMVPGAGAPIAAGARTLARGARTANRVIARARTLGADAPPVRGAAPAEGVAYPGAQDPAAVESRSPAIDTSTELTPEQEAAIAGRQSAGPSDWFEANAPATAAPYPGQQDPAAVESRTPQIDAAVEATPIRTPAAVEPVAAAQTAAEQPQLAQVPKSEVQPADNAGIPAVHGPVSGAAGAEPEPKLLDEPAYDRPVDQQGKPAKTDYQAAARTVKGRAMARLLANPPAGPAITAEEARSIPLGDERWKTIAKLAGVNPPTSPEALQAVFDHMDEIEGGKLQLDLKGTSTDAAGAAAPAGAKLPADDQGNGAGRSVETPDTRAGGQGVPVSRSAAPGSEPGAAATSVEIPGEGRSLPAQYRLRELADIQPSHNGLTFQPNPKYALVNDRNYATPENQGKVIEGSGGKFNPRFHVTDNPDAVNGPPVVDAKGNAIGGNGRTMQLQRVYAYNPEGAAAYREQLVKKANQFGIDPADVAKMKQPVLVREVADEHLGKASDAITDLNKTGTAALTPAERAVADSRRVSPGTLDHIAGQLDAAGPDATLGKVLSGDQGPVILQKLISDGVLTKQETAAYVKDNKLTPDAKTRVSKLMLGRFFRDPAQLDTTPAPIVSKLERLAAPVAKLEGAPGWNITPKLQEALDLLDEARAHGTRNLSEFLKQTGLLGETRYTNDAVTLAKALQRYTGRQLGQAVKDYAATAQYAAEHAHAKAGLFGSQVTDAAPTPAEAFQAAFQPGKPAPAVVKSSLTTPKPKAAEKPGLAKTIGDQFTKD